MKLFVPDDKGPQLARQAQLYLPLGQYMWLDRALVVRTVERPNELLRVVGRIVTHVDPAVAAGSMSTMEQRVAGAVATRRLSSTVLAAFGPVAVVLTAIGVYGVMAYSVAQRRHEVRIRLAFRASGRAVFTLVLRDGVRLIAWALLLGAALTAAMLLVLQAFAHGEVRNHVAVVLLSALLLGIVALIACWVPARQASALNPLAALGRR